MAVVDYFADSSLAQLVHLAEAFVEYELTIGSASRDQRKALEGSTLEDEWSDVLAIFALGSREAPILLPLILERVPADLLSMHVGQLLVQSWIRSEDTSVLPWLDSMIRSNMAMRRVLGGVILADADADAYPELALYTYAG